MRTLIFLFSFLITAASLRAESAPVAAGFQPESTEVGETVRFVVQLTNRGEADRPPVVKADGLDFRYVDETESSTYQLGKGGAVRRRVISYSWEVTPARAGQFTVPAIQVQAGGRRYTTQPVALTVRPAPTASANADRNGRAEIVLPKMTAYVGESLTVTFRLLIDSRITYRIESFPTFEARAFTKTKLSEARSTTMVQNGHTDEITTLQATLTPLKAGKLIVGPVVFEYTAQMPRTEPATPRLPRMFFDQFFNTPGAGGFSLPQRMTATSAVVELEVKPLPVSGRPPHFSGAVGQFELQAQGAPDRVKMGDLITMKLAVTGNGNFDRVTAPVLSDAAGWHAYQPTASSKGKDASAINGAKNFEIALIPQAKKEEMPVYEFAYFDPTAEEYVTRKTDRRPLQVDGPTGLKMENKMENKIPGVPATKEIAGKAQEAEERAAAEAGRMTEAQARTLLASLESEDGQLHLLNPKSRAPRDGTIRDW